MKYVNKYKLLTYSELLCKLNRISPDPNSSYSNIFSYWPNKAIYDISIIVTVFNTNSIFLRECLLSIVNQNFQGSFEVILVDDGSTDLDVIDLVNSFASEYNFIKLIRQPNQGFSSARNVGIDSISGSTIMFVDSDDVLLPKCLDTLFSSLSSQDVDYITANFCVIDNNGSITYPDTSRHHGAPWGRLFKRDVWRNIRFPLGYWFEDTIQNLIIDGTWSEFYLDVPVYGYRINPDGITSNAKFNKKAVDTFWVTRKLLLFRRYLGLPFDLELYNRLLDQFSIVAFSRTRFLTRDEQLVHFNCMCCLFESIIEFKDLNTDRSLIWKILEKSFKHRVYYLWVISVYFLKLIE